MTAQNAYPKVQGDPLYYTEVNAMTRVVGAEYSNTTVSNSSAETDLSSVITIPANTIINGLIVIANIEEGNGSSNASWTYKVKADTSNPPTTIKTTQSTAINAAAVPPDKRLSSVVMVITDLTASSVNYVKLTGKMSVAAATESMTCYSFVVMAY